ncbi:c-myc proto-oncogene, partial, partial [Paramuricea clavata]
MFLSKEMDHLESEVDDIFGGVSLKEKISKYYEQQSIDLKSMLIRDCMWNGESPKKGRNFEKLRQLTKTPPLIDCNLRIMYVDPSEIWPFNFSEQLKAGKVTTADNNNDNTVSIDVPPCYSKNRRSHTHKQMPEVYTIFLCVHWEAALRKEGCWKYSRLTYEEVEVDVVGLEGNQKVELKNKDERPRTKRRRSNESDPDCEILGRATHNVLERKRRNELKLRFQYLRDSIPDICGNDRAPKVSILQKAYSYILQVQAEERSLLQQIRIQKNRKEQLLKK